MPSIFLILGSPDPNWAYLRKLMAQKPNNSKIYAIDSGLQVCVKLTLTVDKLIGDFDSIDPKLLGSFPVNRQERYSPEKDASDTELAIDLCLKEEFQPIYLVNGTSGRTDHTFFNILMCEKRPGIIRLLDTFGTLWALTPKSHHSFLLPPQTTFSLLPMGICQGVTIRGAKYLLTDAELGLTSWSLSNVSQKESIEITYHSGILLIYCEGIYL